MVRWYTVCTVSSMGRVVSFAVAYCCSSTNKTHIDVMFHAIALTVSSQQGGGSFWNGGCWLEKPEVWGEGCQWYKKEKKTKNKPCPVSQCHLVDGGKMSQQLNHCTAHLCLLCNKHAWRSKLTRLHDANNLIIPWQYCVSHNKCRNLKVEWDYFTF